MSIPLDAVRMDNEGQQRTIISGTGTIVHHAGGYYLVTNWHIATGRERIAGAPLASAALPERLVGWLSLDLRATSSELAWHAWGWDLYSAEGHARWLVHPVRGHSVDVVALPIEAPEAISSGWNHPTLFFPYSLAEPADPAWLSPASDVSIIGYPYGISAGGKLPVWTRGSVASEPAANFGDEPCFLIDARTRQGQSGSPVIGYWRGTKVRADGTTAITGESWEFFGVYSGRISSESDLGRVWRRDTVREIVEGGRFDDLSFE